MPPLFFSSAFASILRRDEWLQRMQAGGKFTLCSVLHLNRGTNQHPHGLLTVNLLLLDELRRSLAIGKLVWIMLSLLQLKKLPLSSWTQPSSLPGAAFGCVQSHGIPVLPSSTRLGKIVLWGYCSQPAQGCWLWAKRIQNEVFQISDCRKKGLGTSLLCF